MNDLLRSFLKIQNIAPKKSHQSVSGFTMIELLVGAILAFLIITPMMGFVISILEDDNREGLKAITDQEVNTAANYIAEDLSQARYIYNNQALNDNGANSIVNQIPTVDDGTPILVFWKRKLIKDAVPIAAQGVTNPSDCDPDVLLDCGDTYLESLVAYYLVGSSSNATKGVWCNPDSNSDECPARIVRVEIQDGLKDGSGNYYADNDLRSVAEQGRTLGFLGLQDAPNDGNPRNWQRNQGETYPNNLDQVLVNYIDRSANQPATNLPPGDNDYCQLALGSPTVPGTTTVKDEDIIKIKTDSNSFVACVDSDRSIAHITIRGNALRRKQSDAEYDQDKSSFFPTATVKVTGQSTPIP